MAAPLAHPLCGDPDLGPLALALDARHCPARGVSCTAIFMNLLPVMTAALAISWLGEWLTSYHLIGGGMTLDGGLLAQLLVRP